MPRPLAIFSAFGAAPVRGPMKLRSFVDNVPQYFLSIDQEGLSASRELVAV